VNDQPAGEVHHAQRGEPTAAPDPVGDRGVHQEQPDRAEQEHGRKGDALGVGADDQRRRDDREGHLEHEVDDLGHRAGEGFGAGAAQESAPETADDRIALVERQAVRDRQPEHGDQAADREAVHQHGQQVARPHQPAIEQGKARQGHEQHERGRGDDPRGVAGVQPGRLLGESPRRPDQQGKNRGQGQA
jgi:hypothetical protein